MKPSSRHHSTCQTGPIISGLVLLLLLPGFGTAQESTEPGEVQDAPDDIAAKPVIDEQAYLAVLANKTRYESAIRDLESRTSGNTYSAELAEAYMSLAGTLETLEEFDAAADAYNMALQSIRISNGLSSLQQIPVIEQLVANHERRQDWEGVDTYLHLIYHINIRNFPPGNERRVAAIDKLGRWKLRAATGQLLGDFRNNAYDAARMYGNELRLLEESDDYPGKYLQLATLHLGEGRARLQLAKQVYEQPLRDFNTGERQTVTQQRCYAIRLPDGKVQQVCETVEVPNINYYLQPSNQKMQEVNTSLVESRKSIMRAWQMLQVETNAPETRDRLLEDVQVLTGQYNEFMTKNSL